MNAQALLSYFRTGHIKAKKPAKDFPPEAYDYDDAIDPIVVTAIQVESDKMLDKQEWTVVELMQEA